MYYYCYKGSCVTDRDGDDCDANNTCLASAWGPGTVKCVSKTCKEQMNSGDSCSKNSDCALNMTCSKSKCQHVSTGKTCHSTVPYSSLPQWAIKGQDCDYNKYCDPESFTCNSTLAKGATCDPDATTGAICGMNLVCDRLSKKCITMFSLAKGKRCYPGSMFSCDSGLYCKVSGFNGTCQSSVTKWKTCKVDTDCSSDGSRTCVCQPNGKKYCTLLQQGSCMSEQKDFYKCLADNKCSTGVASQNENSCSQIKCEQEITDFKACTMCDQYNMGDCVSDKDQDKYCPAAQLETWEKLTILAVIVVVVIVIIVVITACCCCSSKSKKYQPI